MNRFLRFCSWIATAFCAIVGFAGFSTPYIGGAIGYLLCAVILSPPFGRILERFGNPVSVGVRAISIVVIVLIAGATVPSSPQTAQSVPASASAAPQAKCETAAGQIWTGVRLYLDSECKRPFATVTGGGKRDGDELVQIRFDQGAVEWKKRTAVRDQAFVISNDPAIARQEWTEIQK